MAAKANRWKLGLFVLTGFLLGLGSIAWLSARWSRRETVHRVTYFQESVQGLDVGAPVKFRGVKIGIVSGIGIAPDHRSVQVEWNTYVDDVIRLGLVPAEDVRRHAPVPATIRVQLATTGLVGTKFIQADVVDPAKHPPPLLSFETPTDYVPSMPSALGSLEQRAVETLDRLPGLAEDATAFLRHLDRTVDDVDAPGLVRDARRVLASVEAQMEPLGDTIAELDSTLKVVERELREAHLGETIATIRSAGAGVSAAAESTVRLEERLEGEVDTVHRTLESVRALADTLERDPGALLHGKSADARPPGDGR